jgi:hypothetical protein
MDSSPTEEQTAYMLVVDLSSSLVTSSFKVYQSPLIGSFVFNPLFSLLPNLFSYNIP